MGFSSEYRRCNSLHSKSKLAERILWIYNDIIGSAFAAVVVPSTTTSPFPYTHHRGNCREELYAVRNKEIVTGKINIE